MKPFVAAIALFAAVAPAAAVTVTSLPGAPDPGPAAGETNIIDFDAGLPGGVTLTGNGSIVAGSTGRHASPSLDRTPYLSVPENGGAGTATLDWSGKFGSKVRSASFYWGSIDGYNSVDLRDAAGNVFFTLSGNDIPPHDGNQSAANTNRRVFFTLGKGETLSGFNFNSTGIAYEVDTVSLNNAVPEPATWALMIAGFGMVGAAVRRHRATPTVAA